MIKYIAIIIVITGSYILFFNDQPATNLAQSPAQISDTKSSERATQLKEGQATTPLISRIPPKSLLLTQTTPMTTLTFTKGDLMQPSVQAEKFITENTELPADLTAEEYIDFNRNLISDLKQGANFNIPIPQLGRAFQATVDDVVVHKNGDKTIQAKLSDNSEDFSVTITQGKAATFATIGTPDGVFMLEATGNSGWIASKTDLRSKHDYTVTDAVIPPEITQPAPPPTPEVSAGQTPVQ
ncbi:MAG: hypothetical protein HOM11_12575 [Methylococcales bacterium]|jgi:hypothetical protein|nr:hypothetical protein [Methylococcales bacterium]MBT7445459.1 hypothetical protein [Methylococcales bacterium]